MKRQLALKLRLDGHTSLEDYVGHAAARLLQLRQLIYLSGVSGKSHLLQGLCHDALGRGQSAIYLPLGDESGSPAPSILEGLESVDLICLDDVDCVLGDRQWQLGLFHLINACRDHDTKLVLSGSTDVTKLPTDLKDLTSRLLAAYRVITDDLDDEGKLEVVRRRAARRGFAMNADVCNFILARSRRDLKHLTMLVDQLDEETLRQQKKVTIPFVKHALGL